VITLPGVYSVIVPPPSVVVVVVVVLEVCAQANGATNASAMLSIVFFTFIPSLWVPFGERVEFLLTRERSIRSLLIRIRTAIRFPLLSVSSWNTNLRLCIAAQRLSLVWLFIVRGRRAANALWPVQKSVPSGCRPLGPIGHNSAHWQSFESR